MILGLSIEDCDDLILSSDVFEDGRESLPRNRNKSWPSRELSDIDGVIYHQSLDDYGTASGNAKYHTSPNHISSDGLPGLSYTLFCDRGTGKIVLANPVKSITFSQGNQIIWGDENRRYLSVCFGGNFDAPGYKAPNAMGLTQSQYNAAIKGWDHLKSIFGFQDNQLFGHHHFGKAACPGYELMAVIDHIRSRRPASKVLGRDLSSSEGRQSAMRALGYYHGALDGEWGTQSKYSLSTLQAASSLTADGVWGPHTERAVELALCKLVGLE